MEKIRLFFSFLSQKTIWLLSALASLLLVVLLFSGRGLMLVNTAEQVTVVENSLLFYASVLVFLGFLYALSYVFNHVSEKTLFLTGFVLSIFVGSYLILNVDALLRSDPRYVFESAQQMNAGDFSSLLPKGLSHYLSIFPLQIGLVSLFRVYEALSDNVRWIWFYQLVMVQGINFLLWKISDRAFSNKLLNKYVIVLSYLFLPSLFLILWAYGDIPGLFFVLLGAYCLLSYYKKSSIIYLVPVLISLFLATMVRSNYLIFGLALVAVVVLKWLEDGKFKHGLVALVILASMALPSPLVKTYYEKIEKVTIPQSVITLAWVAMGLNDKAGTAGYWDGYTTLILINHGYNLDKANQTIKSDLQERVTTLTEDKTYAKNFFWKKLKGTWAEPTFQSIYTGPMAERQQKSHTALLQSLYENGRAYKIYHYCASLVLATIYVVTFISSLRQLFSKHRATLVSMFPYIYLIGGILFHLFWETKSRYVYPYIILLLPIVATELSYHISKFMKEK